jgi:hypothetical protein
LDRTHSTKVRICKSEQYFIHLPNKLQLRTSEMGAAIPSIESLLQRRSDLSTFLVHLTRDQEVQTGRDRLLAIVENLRIEARNPFGMAKDHEGELAEFGLSAKTVCFTETPLEQSWMMISNIEGRSIRLSEYGLVFTKTIARKKGCNPIWYLDMTPGHDWLTVPVNALVASAIASLRLGDTSEPAIQVLKLAPFIEQMGPTTTGRKEFWWEREWRKLGDLSFLPSDVVALFAPESDHKALRRQIYSLPDWADQLPKILDPNWGQERMIGVLAGIPSDQLGPFPSA